MTRFWYVQGITWNQTFPDFPGMEDFQGKVIHTHDYKTSEGYMDSRTMVIGVGNSGGDAAVELSHVCSQVRKNNFDEHVERCEQIK